MNIRLDEGARAELLEARDYYNSQLPGLGNELIDEFKTTVDCIIENPEAWQQITPRHRRCRFHRFPYNVIYEILPDTILIIALAHAKRKPGYWRSRGKH